MLVLEDFGGGLGVVEQLVDLLHLLPLHALFPLNTAQQAGWCQQLHSVPAGKHTRYVQLLELHCTLNTSTSVTLMCCINTG